MNTEIIDNNYFKQCHNRKPNQVIESTKYSRSMKQQIMIQVNKQYNQAIIDLKYKLRENCKKKVALTQILVFENQNTRSSIDFLQNIINPSNEKKKNTQKKPFYLRENILIDPNAIIKGHYFVQIPQSIYLQSLKEYNLMNLILGRNYHHGNTRLDSTKKIESLVQKETISENEFGKIHRIKFSYKMLIQKYKIHQNEDFIDLLANRFDISKEFLVKLINETIPAKVDKKAKSLDMTKINTFLNGFCPICHIFFCHMHFDFSHNTNSINKTTLLANFERNTLLKNDFSKQCENYKCSTSLCIKNDSNMIIIDEEVPTNTNNNHISPYLLNSISFFKNKFYIKNPCLLKLLLAYQNSCTYINSILTEKELPMNIHNLLLLPKSTKKIPSIMKFLHIPCYHENGICDPNTCPCIINNQYCEKYCGCGINCPYIFPGCSCEPNQCKPKSNCICIQYLRECDPKYCKTCCAEFQIKKVKPYSNYFCPNTSITYHYNPRTLIRKSTVCDGLGLFAGQLFGLNDFIGEYIGEFLNKKEAERRGYAYHRINQSYLFEIAPNQAIDATFAGNKTRFINHKTEKFANAYADYIFVNGTKRILILAKRQIQPGEEILFDYGEHFNLNEIKEVYNME